MSEIRTQKSERARKDKFGITCRDGLQAERRMMRVFIEELLAKIAKMEASQNSNQDSSVGA